MLRPGRTPTLSGPAQHCRCCRPQQRRYDHRARGQGAPARAAAGTTAHWPRPTPRCPTCRCDRWGAALGLRGRSGVAAAVVASRLPISGRLVLSRVALEAHQPSPARRDPRGGSGRGRRPAGGCRGRPAARPSGRRGLPVAVASAELRWSGRTTTSTDRPRPRDSAATSRAALRHGDQRDGQDRRRRASAPPRPP